MHRLFAPVVAALCFAAFSESAFSAEKETIKVFADSYPVAYFSTAILGDKGDVTMPVPAGKDPITWFPGDDVLVQMQAADLIILNGANFTKWPPKVSLPDEKVVVTTDGFTDDLIRYKHAITHTHGNSKHTHEGIDGHTWMAPGNMRKQAAAIYASIQKFFPNECEDNYGELTAFIGKLDTEFKEVTKMLGDKPLIASHPAYNYIAAEYGWKIENLDLDPEAPLDAKALKSISDAKASHPATIILWESAPLDETASRLESEFGLQSVVFSPCETTPETDFAEVMRANLTALKNALTK